MEYDSNWPMGERRQIWSNSACPNYSPFDMLASRLTDKLSMLSLSFGSLAYYIDEGAISYKCNLLL